MNNSVDFSELVSHKLKKLKLSIGDVVLDISNIELYRIRVVIIELNLLNVGVIEFSSELRVNASDLFMSIALSNLEICLSDVKLKWVFKVLVRS